MKKVLFLMVCMTVLSVQGMYAQKYMTRTGKVKFDATTPTSPEKIAGVNNEVASILDATSGNLVFQIFVKSFKFEKELMEEHFNENYMESDKFPKSEFKGIISNNSAVNYSKDGSYPATATGKLTIHGVTKDVTITGTVVVKGNSVTLQANFTAKLADYGINVPSLVADKLAKEAKVNLSCELEKK